MNWENFSCENQNPVSFRELDFDLKDWNLFGGQPGCWTEINSHRRVYRRYLCDRHRSDRFYLGCRLRF